MGIEIFCDYNELKISVLTIILLFGKKIIMNNQHLGSDFDEFLESENLLTEVEAGAQALLQAVRD